MPLSEEELRLLEQMERALVEEDPKFASTLRGTSLRRSARRRAIVAGFAFVVGVVVLMTGAVTAGGGSGLLGGGIPVGVAGFVIMLVSATVGLTAIRGQQAVAAGEPGRASHGLTVLDGGRSTTRSTTGRTRRRTQRSRASFMERMDERWRRRRDEGGGF